MIIVHITALIYLSICLCRQNFKPHISYLSWVGFKFHFQSVTAVEAIATYRAVTFAKEIRHNSIVLDGDSTAFIDSLKNDEISLADYGHLIEVAKDTVGSFAI